MPFATRTAGAAEGVEYGLLTSVVGGSPLRMPLNGKYPPGPGSTLQCFDRAIGAAGNHDQVRSDRLGSLMVDGNASAQHARTAQCLGQPTPWLDNDIVNKGFAAGFGGAMAMDTHRWEVLVQRTPQRHVQDLQSSTDGEHRQTRLDRVPGQREFELVALSIDAINLRPALVGIQRRVDVTATEESQPCERVEHLGSCRRLRRSEDRRPDTRTLKGLEVLSRHGFGAVIPAPHAPGSEVIRGQGNEGAGHTPAC